MYQLSMIWCSFQSSLCCVEVSLFTFHPPSILLVLAMVLVGSLQLSYHLGPWKNHLLEENLKVQRPSPLPQDYKYLLVSGKYMCFIVSFCSYPKFNCSFQFTSHSNNIRLLNVASPSSLLVSSLNTSV